MATTARATVPLLLLLAATGLLCAASSREQSLQQCMRRCDEDRPSYERAQCVQECKKESEGRQEQEREREHEQGRGRRGEGGSGDREREGQESREPYVFGRRSFQLVFRTEQGSVKALRPFKEVSKLLRGIRDYRVAILKANPRSFVVPSHADAHCIGYVAQGEGVVTTIENGEKRSYTLREGDVFVAPAGTITYLANTDGRRKLEIVEILHTISVPGNFQYFFAAGGRHPESFLSSFSKPIQRAAYKTSDDRLERLFGRRRKGPIVRASEEQIGELRRHATDGGGHGPHWPLPPFGESSRGPYNLLRQRPKITNRHGRLYEADARSFHDLADHDLRVSLVNITAGSMTAPFYNTGSETIAVVLDGQGEVEIVCPHQSRGSEQGKGKRREEEEEGQEQGRKGEEEIGQGYETVRARVSRGSAFVVPVGHPVVEVASGGSSNLQIVCFEVRAEKNEKVYLAGTNNVLRKLDKTAKELAFAASEREVDEVLNPQHEKDFLAGPEESGDRRREEEEEGEGEGRGRRREEQEEREGEGRGRRGRGRGDEAVETLLRMATGGL